MDDYEIKVEQEHKTIEINHRRLKRPDNGTFTSDF